jgi:decaprenylphospho-beta-D-erythro-pentofuranosid-2-ulose 2-reductase
MSKTLLILGAKSDIALAAAREFARNKFDIILAARQSNELASTKSDLEIRFQIKAYLAEFDAEDFDSHTDFYADLPVRPDVVLCAFGYLGEQAEAEKNWTEAKRIIDANYVGAVSILNLVAADFETRRAGSIIGISSVAGERGRQSNYIYGSAKSGFSVYLDGMRHRLVKSGVHVVTVKPGFVETKMLQGKEHPKILTARPDQLARAIFQAVQKQKATLYYLPVWRLIMLMIRNTPEFIFTRTKL